MIGSTSLKIPNRSRSNKQRSRSATFQILRSGSDPDPPVYSTTTLCSYQRKPKVDQRKAKKLFTQNWTFFSAQIQVKTKKKGPYKNWGVFYTQIYVNTKKQKKGLH